MLLAGRFAVARSALLARPDGPVNGVDLSRGAPVVLELGPAPVGRARREPGPGVREVRRHRGGWVVASEPVVAVAPPPPVREPVVRAPRRRSALGRELRTRRVRITGIGAAGVACVLLAAGLIGGTHADRAGTARAAAPPALRVAVPVSPARQVAPRPSVRKAAVMRPAARGGAARLLVVAPRAHPRPPRRAPVSAPPRPSRVTVARRAPARSTGWVAGLFVGS